MAVGLKGYETLSYSVRVFRGEDFSKLMLWVVTGIGCGEDLFAVDEVRDHAVTDFNLSGHPLITVKRSLHIRRCTELTVPGAGDFDRSTRYTQFAGGTILFAVSTMQVKLDANGELLFEFYRGRILSQVLNAAVAVSPGRSAGRCFAHEAILHFEPVVAQLLTVVQGAETVVELAAVPVVANAEDPVLDAEGVAEVFTQRIPRDLDLPTVEVASIKEGLPGGCCRDGRLSEQLKAGEHKDAKEQGRGSQ